MYTIVLDHGLVIRNSDGQVIAPCQSTDDPQFVYYNAWVRAGNRPRVVETMDELLAEEPKA
jgi:hypothetical protein